ncbi:right-handed parallel beta-helix repeat-containing protein [Micromonospora eburnea]|uniref:Right handed beta helix region n=1 Tax=Micromonospora eburnea TaxID=227316 RepID=A0A1C6UQT4_9ACTN|nr:right-handed parallel beta-helix repeat-containing protein [Micromonospora eburnea]SCL56378.1 Right handed beta helix region [Micromonospora eburnea]
MEPIGTNDPTRRNFLRLATAGAAVAAGVAVARPAAAAAPDRAPFVANGALVIDVRDHGARGDGTTDDTAALQAALNAGKGQIVYLPPGTYPVSTMLSVFSGTTVVATATTVIRRTAGPAIMGNGVLGDFTATKWDGESDITIQGGVWDVNAGAVTASGSAFGFSHGHNVRFTDLTVRDVQRHHGIELNAMKTVRVVNCRFEGFSDPEGNRGYSEAVQMDYAGGPSHFGLFGAADFYGCQDIEISGCYAGPSARFPSFPRLAGSHGGPDGHQHTGLRVLNNYAVGCTEWAIRLYDWTDAVVESNQIVGGGGGIQIGPAGVQPGGNIIVRGNTLRDLSGIKEASGRPPDAAICVGRLNDARTRNLVIEGNIIQDVVFEGISVYRTDRAVVAHNVIARCGGVGVRVNSSPRAVISGNNITTPGREGIVAHVGSHGSRISDNLIELSATYGISITDNVDDVVVRDNTVFGAGTTAGTAAALRVSNYANRTALLGNTVRRRGSGSEASYGISITGTCSGTWYTGNDLRNAGPSAAVSDQGIGSLTTPGGLT